MLDDASDGEVGDRWPAGTLVQLHGLVGKPELNGSFGAIVGYDAGKGRFRVRVDDASNVVMAFKQENLRRQR